MMFSIICFADILSTINVHRCHISSLHSLVCIKPPQFPKIWSQWNDTSDNLGSLQGLPVDTGEWEMGAAGKASFLCMWPDSMNLGLCKTESTKEDMLHLRKVLGLHSAQNCRGNCHGSVELYWNHGENLWRRDAPTEPTHNKHH